MAKRLPERILVGEAQVRDGEFCRNCGGEIIVEPADRRSLELPHRRICRTCSAEYGTTSATLYPSRKRHDLPKPGLRQDGTWL